MKRLDLNHGVVEMTHGSGGRAMAQLIEHLFRRHLTNPLLDAGNDGATFAVPAGRLSVSTDAHVISPLFFPGGDIGRLSVHGTINDVAMSGAMPLCLTAAFILEEGFPLNELDRIVSGMAEAASEAGVPVATGDTKVVERGKADGVFITTTGIGAIPEGVDIAGEKAKPGDASLRSGSLGEHGVAVLARRENLSFDTEILSDSAALHTLVADMLKAAPSIHCLRDPTRGGLATTLNELARQSAVGMQLDESAITVRPEVRAVCELLGLDPLYIANEGKLVCICAREDAEAVLAAMQNHPLGRHAAVIGEVTEDPRQLVQMRTAFGGNRVVDWLAGEQLPRIC